MGHARQLPFLLVSPGPLANARTLHCTQEQRPVMGCCTRSPPLHPPVILHHHANHHCSLPSDKHDTLHVLMSSVLGTSVAMPDQRDATLADTQNALTECT
jgi:hypothetical protein